MFTGDCLRIAMVVPPWYEVPPRGYGGLEAICATLVDALTARGHQVMLFGAGRRTGTSAQFVSTMAAPQSDFLGETLPDVLHTARVFDVLRRTEVDVVHDHSLAGPLCADRLRAPTVVTVHGPVTGQLGDYFDTLGRSVRLVAISDDQRRSRPELPWIGTVHHGIPVPTDPGPAGPGANDPVSADPVPADPMAKHPVSARRGGPAIWLARFSPDKGPDLAVRACVAAGIPPRPHGAS